MLFGVARDPDDLKVHSAHGYIGADGAPAREVALRCRLIDDRDWRTSFIVARIESAPGDDLNTHDLVIARTDRISLEHRTASARRGVSRDLCALAIATTGERRVGRESRAANAGHPHDAIEYIGVVCARAWTVELCQSRIHGHHDERIGTKADIDRERLRERACE